MRRRVLALVGVAVWGGWVPVPRAAARSAPVRSSNQESSTVTRRLPIESPLHRYVPSKEELLFDIHDSFSGQQLLAEDVRGDDPDERLTAFIRRHVRMVSEHAKAIGVFLEERKHLNGKQAWHIERRRDA